MRSRELGRHSAALFLLVSGTACAEPSEPATTSLLGEPLYTPELPAERRADFEAGLEKARADHEAHPESEEAVIWHGRRLAYLGRHAEAIDVYTQGLELHPESTKLRRHRGHRYITLRRLEDAVADLSAAARMIDERGLPDEVEPDGLPNALGIPRSSNHTNVWYHLGLAEYVRGDFAAAARAYQRCAEASTNDDMLCAATYWLVLSRRRAGDGEGADAALQPIRAEMDVIENHEYHQLLLVFAGQRSAADLAADLEPASLSLATAGYGLGAWHLVEGRPEEARSWFRRVVTETPWGAFGHLAAEAELAREVTR